MKSFDIQKSEIKDIPIVSIVGYYEGDAGKTVNSTIEGLLRAGKISIILDFSKTTIVSSPGVASLFILAMMITNDFKGRLVLTALDSLKLKLFKMAGLLVMTEQAGTITEAADILKP